MKFSSTHKQTRLTFREIAHLQVSSPAFEDHGFIPSRYTCDGANVNPPLNIADIPSGAQSLALIVDDPDAPVRAWVHWLAWNLPVTTHIKEDTPLKDQGLNDFRENKYGGPCPPYGVHRYFFKVYALNTFLTLNHHCDKKELERAMSGHVLAYGELVGLYMRK